MRVPHPPSQEGGGLDSHDFNNLLGVIIGYADLAARHLEGRHPARTKIEEVRKAADRAAALTRQLLAFSRRQVLQPKLVDRSGSSAHARTRAPTPLPLALALAKPANLREVAAVRHVAPLPAVVACRVHEQPPAVGAAALLEPAHVVRTVE
jgi:signal transduction histidine kinase